MFQIISENYQELISGVVALLWIIVKLTPTAKDNAILRIIDTVINGLFLSKRSKQRINVKFLKDFNNKESVAYKANRELYNQNVSS